VCSAKRIPTAVNHDFLVPTVPNICVIFYGPMIVLFFVLLMHEAIAQSKSMFLAEIKPLTTAVFSREGSYKEL
jgi:hypothetical protein